MQEVTDGAFPTSQHNPYKMEGNELHKFQEQLRERGHAAAAQAIEQHLGSR